jgi:predicted O-methyltransferase YrrM
MRPKNSDQQRGLVELCQTVKNKLEDNNLEIVEIGSYCGGSTEIIASVFKKSKINCVDPWQKYVEDCSVYDLDRQELELKEAEMIFEQVIQQYPNVTKNKTTSSDYVKNVLDQSIDFIYIDGNHQYSSVKEDIFNWLPKIKRGGVLSGHDYGWPSVSRALIEVLNRQPDKNFIDGSWIYYIL